MSAAAISPTERADLARQHINSAQFRDKNVLKRGLTWNEPDRLPEKAILQPIDFDRIVKLSLAALPQLVKRFGLGDHYIIDAATGAWKDRQTGKSGKNVIELFAHAAKTTFRNAAVALAGLIKVRQRPKPVETIQTKVEPAETIAELLTTEAPSEPTTKLEPTTEKKEQPAPKAWPIWLRRTFAIVGSLIIGTSPTPTVAMTATPAMEV
jgi:hypothetical protein